MAAILDDYDAQPPHVKLARLKVQIAQQRRAAEVQILGPVTRAAPCFAPCDFTPPEPGPEPYATPHDAEMAAERLFRLENEISRTFGGPADPEAQEIRARLDVTARKQ